MIGRRFWMTGLLAMLALLTVAAKPAEDWPPGMAILHGFVFHDLNSDGRWNHPNGNGPYDRLNPDRWEPGLGGVMFSVVCEDLTAGFESVARIMDKEEDVFKTGDFGPVLPPCEWVVTMHIPEGYAPTTPVSQTVVMPAAGGTTFPAVLFGLTTTQLPRTGMVAHPFLRGAAVFVTLELGIAVGAGIHERRRRQ